MIQVETQVEHLAIILWQVYSHSSHTLTTFYSSEVAMGRPPLALGETGTIRTYGWHGGRWIAKKNLPADAVPEKWRARANYREFTGDTIPVERHGPTEAKAKAALKAELRERAGKRTALSARSRFSDFATVWLADSEERVADSTMDRYRNVLHKHVLPRFGELRISEIRVSMLDAYFRDLRGVLSAHTRRQVRTQIKQILDIPVRQDLIDHNPVGSMSRIHADHRSRPRALSPDELLEFLELIDADARRHPGDLPDLIRFMLGTGTRVGEACGLRWCDLVLGPTPEDSLIQITGNAVYVTRRGVQRHSGKTFAAKRNIPMAPFLHTLLAVRRPEEAVDTDPVFPAERGGLKNPAVVHNQLARARRRISPKSDPERWAWVTSHVLRKTAATILDQGGMTARQIADILGHADPSMTLRVYLGRGLPNTRAGEILDAAHRKPEA
jgi:integrase